MKAILICPDERTAITALAESAPLSNLTILGKSVVDYWLEHLAALGAKEILILAADRPDQVLARVGDGARWGLLVTVHPDKRERTLDDARAEHLTDDGPPWLPPPHDVILMDHLPGRPHLSLAGSYADWFAGTLALLPHALTPDRIGVRELKPGVWVGWNAHVAADVKLVAPCWIGDGVWIEAGATIGPNAVLEREVFIARGAEVSHSIIGPETCVGQFTEVRNSIAWGCTLINWERDTCLKVPDEFLLCSREPQRIRPATGKATSMSPVRVPMSAMGRFRQYVSQLLT